MDFFPGAHVHFIYGVGLLQARFFPALGHPFLILPLIIRIPDNRSRIGGYFPEKRKRVAFFQVAAVLRMNVILVQLALAQARDEAFPDARSIPARREGMAIAVP